MKLALSLIALAAIPASAQTVAAKPQASVAVAAKTTPAQGGGAVTGLQAIAALEKEMDGRLASTGGQDPCMVLGNTRGIVIPGFGAVFTAEVDLVNTPPGMGLFAAPITAEQKVSVHKRKLEHAKLLQQTLRDSILSLSAAPALKLADTDQVVVSVRLMYRAWEDTKDLPVQIAMRLDRRGGTPKLEVQ